MPIARARRMRGRFVSGARLPTAVHQYDLIADWYALERVDQTGVPEVMARAQSIQRDARVLDVGCGNRIPSVTGRNRSLAPK
jgi:hypothetical protein